MVARHDQATDPRVVADLADVRLGTSVLRRALDDVTDAGLDDASLLPGWDRRHLVAHVGYNARAVARLVTWAATGEPTPMYASPEARVEEIELGATQNPEALRHLCEHAAIDLDVRWRDLPDDRWDVEVVTAQGRTVPVAETVWMRSREVWLHAVDLDTGLRVQDIPRSILGRLLVDVTGVWSRRDGLRLRLRDTTAGAGCSTYGDPDADVEVKGALPDLVAWAVGRASQRRSTERLTWLGAEPSGAPRWL